MPRVLLLLPTSTYRAGDFLDAARALRTEVVVASDHRSAMAARGLADGMVPIDCARPDRAAAAIVELAERTPIDAVVAVDDQACLKDVEIHRVVVRDEDAGRCPHGTYSRILARSARGLKGLVT